MSMQLEDAMRESVAVFGSLAETLIKARGFKDVSDFEPFFPLVREDLERFVASINNLTDGSLSEVPNKTDTMTWYTMYHFARAIGYGQKDEQDTHPPAPTTTPQGSFTSPANAPGVVVKCVDPNKKYAGNFTLVNGLYEHGCGAKMPDYTSAMAHKVFVHGYMWHKMSPGEAEKHLSDLGLLPGTTVVAAAQAATTPTPEEDEADQRAKLATVSAAWVPTLNLKLEDLDIPVGSARRFAVGDEDSARFYYIKRPSISSTIKGRFVWTRFAHRFVTEVIRQGDFVVRKEAGDTKEWVGMQRKAGVWNTAWQKGDPDAERYVHQDIYVGSFEDDVAAILADPWTCQTNYGKWIGRCCYCGRKLTDAESRARGIGPDCWEHFAIAHLHRHVKNAVAAGQP